MKEFVNVEQARWPGLGAKQDEMTGDSKSNNNEARLTDIQGLVVELINRLLSTNIDEIDHAIDDATVPMYSCATKTLPTIHMNGVPQGSTP